jgi:leucyl aminopeptidase
MRIRARSEPLGRLNYPLISLGFFEGQKKLDGISRGIDEDMKGLLAEIITSKESHGEKNNISILHNIGKVRRVLAISLGKKDEYTQDVLRSAAGKVSRRVRDMGFTRFAFILDHTDSLHDVQSLVEGAELGLYNFDRYKSVKGKIQVKEMGIVLSKGMMKKALRAGKEPIKPSQQRLHAFDSFFSFPEVEQNNQRQC